MRNVIAEESILRAHNEDWDSKEEMSYEDMMAELDRMEEEYDKNNPKAS